MSLFRWICLSAPASSDATSLPDRLDGLAQLIDGADRTQLLQLASELLNQACADKAPWQPRTMREWLS
jgi:hypothetical protein